MPHPDRPVLTLPSSPVKLVWSDALAPSRRARKQYRVLMWRGQPGCGSMGQLVAFISYSQADGKDFAISLRDELRGLSPPIEPWIDLDRARGYPFPPLLEEAIGGCDLLLFVLTRDSVESGWCRRELARAMGIGKRILPLRLDDMELPLDLECLPPIDFSDKKKWRIAWKELRDALILIDSLEARLEALKQERRALIRKSEQATGPLRQRYVRDLKVLEARIQEDERRVDHSPGVSHSSVMNAIDLHSVREQTSIARSDYRQAIQIVNDPPTLLPNQFHDRVLEIQRLEDRLNDPAIRLMIVVGRDGIGKTALVSQLFDRLRRELGQIPVHALVYLSAHGSRPIRPAILLEDLRKAAADGTSNGHIESMNGSALTSLEKLDKVIEELAGARVIVVIDNAEALLDPQKRLRDRELSEVFEALLKRRDHGVKLVLVTREAPDLLLRDFPVSADRLNLDVGLPPADAHDFLRSLDGRNILGLRSAPEEHLERVRQLTDGHPRALEAIFSMLDSNPEDSLLRLLNEMEQLPADQDMVDFLIGRMFDQLDSVDRRVLQALAVFGRPVSLAAVDYLLQWYLKEFDSAPVVQRLVERRLVRQEGTQYYLPSFPDGERLMGRIPIGEPPDRHREPPPMTRLALLHRAAGYFASDRKGRVERIDDLSAWFAEIDLRMRGKEYDAALRLIGAIDQQYLSPWGQSDAVAHWRMELVDKLTDPDLALHNLSWLAHARRQQDDLRQAIDLLIFALDEARKLHDGPNQLRIQIALASTYFDNGEVSAAAKLYEQALTAARKQRMRLERAKAGEGLFLCYGEMGQFRRAREHHDAARGLVENRQDEESEILRAEFLLNEAWIHARMGRTEEALEPLHQGQDLARRLRQKLLEGLFLNSEAEVLIDDGHPAQAVKPATSAVTIGTSIHNPHLSREANGTLALAYLCAGDVDAACGAADAAARYRRSRRALGAFALQGITAFRNGEKNKARLAFLEAHVQAGILREREDRNYQVLDTHGLALCGLALCGDPDQFERARSTYSAARGVTREGGVVRRVLRLLDELGRGHESDLLTGVRRAASGR
jgi:tetratricopeptide (TPR) repeat protein